MSSIIKLGGRLTMTKKQLPIGRILAGALIALLLSGFAFVAYKVNQVQMAPTPNSPLIGTWKSSRGDAVNYRADGTARYRGSVDGTPNQILYFEWTIDNSNNLLTCNSCSSEASAWKQRLNDWIYRYDSRQSVGQLVDVSDSGFTVRKADGTEMKYVATEDKEMELAP